jgi:hypothetical protein
MYAYCQDMPGVTEEMAERVQAEIGEPLADGVIAHVAGPVRGGWRIIDVWESEEACRRFQAERLGPALQRATAGMPPPPVPFDLYELHGSPALSRLPERLVADAS